MFIVYLYAVLRTPDLHCTTDTMHNIPDVFTIYIRIMRYRYISYITYFYIHIIDSTPGSVVIFIIRKPVGRKLLYFVFLIYICYKPSHNL